MQWDPCKHVPSTSTFLDVCIPAALYRYFTGLLTNLRYLPAVASAGHVASRD